MKSTNLKALSHKNLKTTRNQGCHKPKQLWHFFLTKNVILILIGLLAISGCAEKGAVDQISISRHIKQSKAYLSQGQFRAANIEARNAIQASPENIHGHIALGSILNKLGRYKKSIEQLEQLPANAYLNSEFLYTLFNAYMGRGKYVSAAEILKSNEALMSLQQPEYSLALAGLYEAQEDLANSEGIYHQSLKLAPNNVDGLLGLIRVKYQQTDIYNAESLIKRAQEIDPLNPDIDYIRAQISIDKQQYGEAENLLTEAISNLPNADVMTPRKSAFLQLLSETLTRQGKTTEAIIYTQKIAEAFPGAEVAQGDFRDASLLFEKGEFDNAESILEKLVNEYPNFEDASVFWALSNIAPVILRVLATILISILMQR